MKNINHHTALLILAISVTLMVSASYFYMFYQVGTSVERAVVANDLVSLERSYKSREKDLVTNYESSATNRKRLIGFFLPSDRTVQFIEAIESLGPVAGSNVELSSITSVDPEKGKVNALGSVRAHVEVKGSWSSVIRTLMLAEALPYNTNINQVRLDTSVIANSKSAREWRLSFDIELNTIEPPLTNLQN